MPIPQPPKMAPKEESKALTEDDISFILKSTLTPDHYSDPVVLKFIMNYLETSDIKSAAAFAGIHHATARKLRNAKDIHNCIAKIREQSVMKYGFDAEEVVARTREIAEVDPAMFVDPETGAAIMNLHHVPLEARRALKSFKVKNLYDMDPNGMNQLIGHLVEYSFWDKPGSLRDMGGEKELFTKKSVVEQEVSKGMKSLLLGSIERAEARVLEAREVKDVPQITGEVLDATYKTEEPST